MKIPGRRLSALGLGVLSVLVATAIALSLETAPPNADQQVNVAAKNTATASSFLVEIRSLVRGYGASQGHHALIAYRAPEALQVTASPGFLPQSGEVKILGGRGWLSLDGGRTWSRQGSGWVRANRGDLLPVLMNQLQLLSEITGFVKKGNVYSIVRRVRGPNGKPSSLVNGIYATVRGEFIRAFRISLTDVGSR
ncbi:MAG TPA: hypothetical protein VEJ87_16920, partial [Acidimicrobiales bacterium]|nr:hypothetical protein [Acidimicrobiales bacterium]